MDLEALGNCEDASSQSQTYGNIIISSACSNNLCPTCLSNCLIHKLNRILSRVIPLKWPGQNIHCFEMFSVGFLQRKFPLHSGRQAVPHSPEPSAICSYKTDIAKDAKTQHLFSQSACGCLDEEVNYQGGWGGKKRHSVGSDSFLLSTKHAPVSGGAWKTHLRGLDVLQRGRKT